MSANHELDVPATLARIPRATVRPGRSLELLSHREIAGLLETDEEVYRLFRRCALAVLNTGGEEDDSRAILEAYRDFDVRVVPQSRGLKLVVHNAPASAFVDGVMIRGIQEHLFSALRDIVYTQNKISQGGRFDLSTSDGITDAVFRILRNAEIVRPNEPPGLVVCWGGHAVSREEYDFSKEVGYELGLRGFNIGTGCGIGAMKGPMKGATIGHAKQQIHNGRYIGISEPGIIASEAPNPIVNELVILPDIEKRLEAFVRLSHAIVVFPGGVGTAEEILYLLGILLNPVNRDIPLPLIFAAPNRNAGYFDRIDRFIVDTLGDEARDLYRIMVGDPVAIAREAKQGIERVHRHRRRTQEAYYFNWQLAIDREFQAPFTPDHRSMAALDLSLDQPVHTLAANLRRAFSGIVSGNVKEAGIVAVEKNGPFEVRGDARLMASLDELLAAFAAERRMKVSAATYKPCYKIVA